MTTHFPVLTRCGANAKVILEVELGEAEKPKPPALMPSVAKALAWHLYEFEQGGQVRKVLYSMGTRTPGRASSELAVSFMRDEALAYLDYIETILVHQGAGQSSIDKISELKLWVRQEWEFTPAASTSPLTNHYYSLKTTPRGNQIVVNPVDECDTDSGECAPSITAKPGTAPPNHCRFPKSFTPVEFFHGSLEEKVAEKPESISWGPLIVDFKTNEPAAP